MESEKIIECVTEEKAIEMLKLFRSEFDVDSKLPNAMMFDIAIRAIEENDKLKSQVEKLKTTISKMETTTDKVFEETICRWHDSDVDLRVFEYLGITEKEYGDWLTRSCK